MPFYKKKHSKIKISTADKWFSLYIRIRDAYDNGWCRCITCKKPIFWNKGAQCGHYATRGHPMTRFNEQNCHAQCATCNAPIWGKGEQAKHAIAIDDLYGIGTARKLIELSEIRGQKVYAKIALKEISKEYRIKFRELARQKGIEV